MQLKAVTGQTSNASKRGWTPEEDSIILRIMSSFSEHRFKWIEVSRELQQMTGRFRTGKQCRERWQHQLNPDIVKDEWSQAEQLTLFEAQTRVGNKWSQIAVFLPGRTDNGVKNFFYSSVRRVLTKLNVYLGRQKDRKQFKIIRPFEADYLSKLMAVVDGHYDRKMRISGEGTVQRAKIILAQIIRLVSEEHTMEAERVEECLDNLIMIMQDFRKNCKKRKQVFMSEENQRHSESVSLDDSNSEGKSSSSNEREQEHQNTSPRKRSASISNMSPEPMDLQFCPEVCPEVEKLFLSHKNSTKSMEEEEMFGFPEHLKLKAFESIYEDPKLFKGMTEMVEDKSSSFLDLFREDQGVKVLKDQQQEWENSQFDVFQLPFGQPEDILGASQIIGSAQIVTNYKMLEASIALDQLLLKPSLLSQLSHNN